MARGELRFLIGPNGAGKTTLLDVICRKVKESSGRIFFEGRDFVRSPIHQVARMGISRKFQAPSIFPGLSVMENMELAYPRGRGILSSLRFRFNSAEIDEIDAALRSVGLEKKRETPASELSHGQKQWLEIALTLIQRPKLLLADEPAAGMTRDERNRTGEILEAISARTSVLVVEHDMKFVERFARKVSVLHEGSIICEGSFEKVSSDEKVLSVYLGRGEG